MKRYINILMVALATMMTSCLTEDPRDQLYEEDIYNNANNIYINAVAVLYNYIGGSADSEGLQGTCRGIYDYNTLTTDEAMIPIRGGDWYDGGLWEMYHRHQYDDINQGDWLSEWENFYVGIGQCNMVLDDLNQLNPSNYGLSDSEFESFKAQLRLSLIHI